MTVRAMRFLSMASVVGADQTAERSRSQRRKVRRQYRRRPRPFGIMRGCSALDLGDTGKSAGPPHFQLRSDQVALWIGGVAESRSRCKISMVPTARHREIAGKLHLPAIQGIVLKQTGRGSSCCWMKIP